MNIGLPQVTGALLLRIVSVVGILVIGWLFVHLVLSARHGGTPVKTGASAATPTGPTVMPDARDELLTARRVVQQAERRTAARQAAAGRAAARQRADQPPRGRPASSSSASRAGTRTTRDTTRLRRASLDNDSHDVVALEPDDAPAGARATAGVGWHFSSCTPGDLGC